MLSEHEQLTQLLHQRSNNTHNMTETDIFANTTQIQKLINDNPKTPNVHYSYGTSGFRGLANTLNSIVVRSACIAVLRSHSYTVNNDNNNTVGVMITASHNDASDNGIKFIDANGAMLVSEWELQTDIIANAEEHSVIDTLKHVCNKLNVSTKLTGQPLRVLIAHDTRASSQEFISLLQQSIQAFNAQYINYGLITTPQLHWITANYNFGHTNVSVQDYNTAISTAFNNAIKLCTHNTNKLSQLILDCSNGVGAAAMKQLQPLLQQTLDIELHNIDVHSTDLLNNQCGAEHVHKVRTLPYKYDDNLIDRRLASLDGDADRLVYYYIDKSQKLYVLDGDKLIALYVTFILKLIDAAQLRSKLSIGIIQTAYANGASTLYMRDTLKLNIEFTPTGVKHLHHKAVQYDIGIYFESNGHGTVVFSENAKRLFKQLSTDSSASTEQRNAAEMLLLSVTLINQYIGDAISDLLLVELSLHYLQWTIQQWNAIYNDCPSATLKCKVRDRMLVKTTNADRTCIAPEGLQTAIDKLITDPKTQRVFVRPSGTEDIIRIYAEAETQEQASKLGNQVVELVQQFLA